MISRFGLFADPSQARKVTLRNHILSLPIVSLESRLSHSSCHNLCTTKSPPPFTRSLLGLGLKFCPKPDYTTGKKQVHSLLNRFATDLQTKCFFAGAASDWTPKQLYIRDDTWYVKDSMKNRELQARIDSFRKRLIPLFHRRKVHSNLTPIQQQLLLTLRHNPDFIVVNSDKNLGPVILERNTYIRRCFTDHLLSDDSTYDQLSPAQAAAFTSNTAVLLSRFLTDYKHAISEMDMKYLHRSLALVTDPYAYFYALAKIHKSPWKTRPIVSVSGSLLYGIGKWLDQQLQPLIQKLPTYLPSSFQLKDDLDRMAGTDFSRISVFTGDVVAMYPSIDLDDAFNRIRTFLSTNPLCEHIDPDPIMEALELIMKRNCFRFGDTYWLQTNGTAMGTPPAPSFATLYYGIFELDLLQRFDSSLHYLRRYIDDQFGLWIHDKDPEVDRQRWEQFKSVQGNYCSLDWEFSPLLKEINFLDLTLSLEPFCINTKLYEKPMNLHLYIPPNSAHPSSVRLGLVTGGIFRILQLTSRDSDKAKSLSKFHSYLFARGYKLKFLYFAFKKALAQFAKPRKATVTTPSSTEFACFLHLPFHSRDPTRRTVQRIFYDEIMRPTNVYKKKTLGRLHNHTLVTLPLIVTEPEPYLYELLNHDRVSNGIDRLIVAYSRPPNLKNLLFPRHVESKCSTAPTVSAIQNELLNAATNPEPL